MLIQTTGDGRWNVRFPGPVQSHLILPLLSSAYRQFATFANFIHRGSRMEDMSLLFTGNHPYHHFQASSSSSTKTTANQTIPRWFIAKETVDGGGWQRENKTLIMENKIIKVNEEFVYRTKVIANELYTKREPRDRLFIVSARQKLRERGNPRREVEWRTYGMGKQTRGREEINVIIIVCFYYSFLSIIEGDRKHMWFIHNFPIFESEWFFSLLFL